MTISGVKSDRWVIKKVTWKKLVDGFKLDTHAAASNGGFHHSPHRDFTKQTHFSVELH